MSFRGCFALLVSLVISLAGCQRAATEPEPDNIDGRKVRDALADSLLKAVSGQTTTTNNTPGDAPPSGADDADAL
jgi:hypothetical protein